MASILLTAYLPIPMPSEPQNNFKVAAGDMIDELCALSGILEFPLEKYGVSQVTIELVETPFKNQTGLEQWIEPKDIDECKIIRITTEINTELHWLYLIDIFQKRVIDLIVAANIAHLGSLENHEGFIFKDERPCSSIRSISAFSLREVSSFTLSKGWPKLQKLDFAKVWIWALKQPGFLVGFGGGPTGRAINAFTHLFESQGYAIDLLWAMVGLEALYVVGQGVSEQVREKVWLLLGKRETHKREITQLYTFRSKFVHGGLDFLGMHCLPPDGLATTVEKHTDDLIDSASLAQAILVATLQELVRRDWSALSFSYTASDLGEPTAT